MSKKQLGDFEKDLLLKDGIRVYAVICKTH